MSYITVKDVNKYYPTDNGKRQVLKDVYLDIEKGEFICLLGASGCGKTTLLNLVAGFEKPDSGEILIDGNFSRQDSDPRAESGQDKADHKSRHRNAQGQDPRRFPRGA